MLEKATGQKRSTCAQVMLAPLRAEDSEILYSWISDRETRLFNSPYTPVSDLEHKSWFDQVRSSKDEYIFGIRTLTKDELIGSCQLLNINRTHRIAELQIRLGEERARGQGFGSQALQLLLRFGFKDLNLRKISLKVFADNVRAITAYEKNGFVHEGSLRKEVFVDGDYKDVICMGILSDEWENQC